MKMKNHILNAFYYLTMLFKIMTKNNRKEQKQKKKKILKNQIQH